MGKQSTHGKMSLPVTRLLVLSVWKVQGNCSRSHDTKTQPYHFWRAGSYCISSHICRVICLLTWQARKLFMLLCLQDLAAFMTCRKCMWAAVPATAEHRPEAGKQKECFLCLTNNKYKIETALRKDTSLEQRQQRKVHKCSWHQNIYCPTHTLKILGSLVWYLTSQEIDAKRCVFSFLFLF